jgi:hypothetical protein
VTLKIQSITVEKFRSLEERDLWPMEEEPKHIYSVTLKLPLLPLCGVTLTRSKMQLPSSGVAVARRKMATTKQRAQVAVW